MTSLAHPREAPLRFAHPREARLRKRREFDSAHRLGTRTHARQFTLIILDSDAPRARFGTAISRRVGGAVVRNRLRRVLKEIFRHHAHAWPAVDVVLIAKPELATLAHAKRAEVEAVVLPVLERAARRGGRRK